MTWTAPDPGPMPVGPDVGGMRDISAGYLAAMRWTLLNLCAGLTAEQLATRSVPPSTLSLLGLVRHLTKVERYWWRIAAAGEDVEPLFPAPDEDFDAADETVAAQAISDFLTEVARCDEVAAGLSLDRRFSHRGDEVSVGLVYVHLVHEYARHAGHGDLLRQAIDGATGR